MRASASSPTTKKDALVVPANALVDLGGRRGVFLRAERTPRCSAPVQVGTEAARRSRDPRRARRGRPRHHHRRGRPARRRSRPRCRAGAGPRRPTGRRRARRRQAAPSGATRAASGSAAGRRVRPPRRAPAPASGAGAAAGRSTAAEGAAAASGRRGGSRSQRQLRFRTSTHDTVSSLNVTSSTECRYEHSSSRDSAAGHDVHDQRGHRAARRHLADPAAGRPDAGVRAADASPSASTTPASARWRWRSSITRPLEQAVSAVAGLERVESTSSEGNSQVRLNFDWGTDMAEAADEVRTRIDRVRGRLPEDADPPTIFKSDSNAHADHAARRRRRLRPGHAARDGAERARRRASSASTASRRSPSTAACAGRFTSSCRRKRSPRSTCRSTASCRLLRQENQNTPLGEIYQGDATYLVRSQGQFTEPRRHPQPRRA